jgi:hypothetical protein
MELIAEYIEHANRPDDMAAAVALVCRDVELGHAAPIERFSARGFSKDKIGRHR